MLMRLSAIRSVRRFQSARFSNSIRLNSDLAVVYLNPASSDSSTDEHSNTLPCLPGNPSNLGDIMVGWDTGEVAEVLHSCRRDPKQALSLFYDLRLRGFQHNVETYVGIVSIVCEHRMGSSLEALLSEIINVGETELGFGINELIEALLERFELKEDSGMIVRVIGEFLRAYTALGMYEEAVDMLFQTSRKGFAPCIVSCNSLLDRLIKDAKVDMALAVYQQLKRSGLTPNVDTYNILMVAYCRKGGLEGATELINEMERTGVHPNEFTYRTLVEGLCSQGKTDAGYAVLKYWQKSELPFKYSAYADVIRGFGCENKLDRAEEVLGELESQGSVPLVCCFSALIQAYYQHRHFVKVLSLHESMVVKGLKTNKYLLAIVIESLRHLGLGSEVLSVFQYFKGTGIYLDEMSYLGVLVALCKIGDMDEAEKLVNEMRSTGMVLTLSHYSTLMHGYCLAGNLSHAFKIFDEVRSKGMEVDVVTYTILVGAFCKNGLIDEAFSLVQLMQAQGVEWDGLMYKEMIEGLCICGNVQAAEAIFNGVETKCLYIYSGMLSGYCEANCVSEALKVFDELSCQGLTLDRKYFLKLFDSLLKEGEHEKAVELFINSTLAESTSLRTHSIFMRSLCKAGYVMGARRIFDALVQRGLEPDITIYTVLMNGYGKAGYMKEAYDLFNEMKLRGIQPTISTYTVLLDGHLHSCLKPKSPSRIGARGKDIMENVSHLFREMKEMNINMDVVTYTCLIDKYCKSNKIQSAQELFMEMMEKGVEPNTVTYHVLLSGYCSKNDLAGALALIDFFSQRGVDRDDATILLERSVLEAAKSVIKVEYDLA